jgi:hypothetical protein
MTDEARIWTALSMDPAAALRSGGSALRAEICVCCSATAILESYWPATISKGDTQVTAGSSSLLHFGQVNTWVPVSLLPSVERQSETDICRRNDRGCNSRRLSNRPHGMPCRSPRPRTVDVRFLGCTLATLVHVPPRGCIGSLQNHDPVFHRFTSDLYCDGLLARARRGLWREPSNYDATKHSRQHTGRRRDGEPPRRMIPASDLRGYRCADQYPAISQK